MHSRDVWAVEPEKLVLIKDAVDTAVDKLRSSKSMKKCKAEDRESSRSAKKARGSGYEHGVAMSDSDFWYVFKLARYDVDDLILSLLL